MIGKRVGLFTHKGRRLPGQIDQIYVIEKAEKLLQQHPQYNFETLIQS